MNGFALEFLAGEHNKAGSGKLIWLKSIKKTKAS
jgi:hypothetical protein